MRPELEIIEKIEQYLNNSLSPEDKTAFERQMANDPGLKEQVTLQQQVMRGIGRAVMKQKIQIAKRNFYRGKNFMRWGIGGFGVLVLVTAALLFFRNSSSHQYVLPEYNERGEKQWVDADKNVAAQTFTIDGSKDTVIETKGGIVMAITSNSFVDNDGSPVDGSIDLVVKEALDPASIIRAGLSTRSGDQLLETGGMFYLDARKDKQILKIGAGKSIHAEVPTKEVKSGMQLFAGQRTANGRIDWVDPKPLAHDLVALDIQTLNFYPPGYLDSLQRWGYEITNKEFTDSLYYSFASLFAEFPEADSTTNTMVNADIEPITDSAARRNDIAGRDLTEPLSSRTLFISKCATCHKVFGEATGPRLGGVLNNDYYKGNLKKVMRWVYNVNTFVNSDTHYVRLKERFGSLMQPFSPATISEKELTAIFNYIDDVYQSGVEDLYQTPCGINPAKIKAIRTGEFENTILATREFEERLKLIHRLKQPELLDLYVNNLDKDLWYIDSLAAKIAMAGGINPFREFATRRDGKVKNGNRQAEMLKNYYAARTRALTEAIAKTQNEFWAKQEALDIETVKTKSRHQIDSSNRVTNNLTGEFETNLKSVFRQLGYNENIQPSAGPAYQVDIVVTGWCNIDRYVYEATKSRTTFNYTDTQTGKQAIIRYQAASIQINDWNEYDRLYVYLLPDSLNSFMQLVGNDGIYSEKLNALMKYDLLCIGYKGEEAWIYSQKNIQPRDYTGITLEQVKNEELDKRLNAMGNRGQSNDLKNETDYFRLEFVDMKRQKQNLALRQLTARVKYFLFRCSEASFVSNIPKQ